MTTLLDDLCMAYGREWLLLRRQSSHLINGFCFFLLIGLVYQILLGPNLVMPQGVTLTLLWVLSFLSILLIADGWLVSDLKNGFYELWMSQSRSLSILFFAKLSFQWIVIGLLLSVFAPLVGLGLGLDTALLWLTVASLVVSSLAMICLCGFGAVITAGQSSSGLLMAVLVLPLNIPPMIFGAGVVLESLQGYDSMPIFMLTVALSIASISFVPWLMSFCTKVLIE